MKPLDNLMDTNMISKLLMRLMAAAALGLITIAYGYSLTTFIN